MITTDILNQLAATLSIARTESTPTSTTFNILPDVTALSVNDILTAPANLACILKNVIFGTALPEQSVPELNDILRGLPIPDPASAVSGVINGLLQGSATGTVAGGFTGMLASGTLTDGVLNGALNGTMEGALNGPVSGTLSGTAGDVIGNASNAAGLLVQLAGTIPLSPITLPVSATIQWSVWNTNISPEAELMEGGAFLAPNGLTAPSATFLILPFFERRGGAGSTLTNYTVRVTITLKAAGVSSDPITLSMPIPVPVIQLPTMLAMFRHPNYMPRLGKLDGVVAIIVTADSHLGSWSQTVDELATIARALEPWLTVASLLPFVRPLAGALAILSAAISAQPIVIFVTADSSFAVRSLYNYAIDEAVIRVPLLDYTIFQLTAEDRFDSFIFLGVPGNQVDLYNAPNLTTGEGILTAITGQEMAVFAPDLRSAMPVGQPASSVTVTEAPNNAWQPRGSDPFDWGHQVKTFGHECSSVVFTVVG